MSRRRLATISCGVLTVSLVLATAARAQDEQLDARAKSAAKVLANLVSDPKNSPPNKLLRSAECMAVVPGVKEGAVVVGGKVGYGMASCRAGAGWSLPTYMALKAGSVGFQVGGQASDVVLIFTHTNAPQRIAKSNFELGAQASVAAGPVGSTIGTATDFKKGSEIYSYSTKGAGVFAGIALSGSKFEVDDKGNRKAYPAASVPTKSDKSPDVASLLKTPAGPDIPAGMKPFLDALNERIGTQR